MLPAARRSRGRHLKPFLPSCAHVELLSTARLFLRRAASPILPGRLRKAYCNTEKAVRFCPVTLVVELRKRSTLGSEGLSCAGATQGPRPRLFCHSDAAQLFQSYAGLLRPSPRRPGVAAVSVRISSYREDAGSLFWVVSVRCLSHHDGAAPALCDTPLLQAAGRAA